MATIPVFLLGKSHGHRSLVGGSAWGRKELGTTERLTSIRQMSRQLSRGSADEYQADEQAGVARLRCRVSGR